MVKIRRFQFTGHLPQQYNDVVALAVLTRTISKEIDAGIGRIKRAGTDDFRFSVRRSFYCFFQTETKVNIYRFFGKFLQLFQIRRVAAVYVNTAIGQRFSVLGKHERHLMCFLAAEQELSVNLCIRSKHKGLLHTAQSSGIRIPRAFVPVCTVYRFQGIRVDRFRQDFRNLQSRTFQLHNTGHCFFVHFHLSRIFTELRAQPERPHCSSRVLGNLIKVASCHNAVQCFRISVQSFIQAAVIMVHNGFICNTHTFFLLQNRVCISPCSTPSGFCLFRRRSGGFARRIVAFKPFGLSVYPSVS